MDSFFWSIKSCPLPWMPIAGKCYLFSSDQLSQPSGQKFCETNSIEGKLLEPRNLKVYTAVRKIAQQKLTSSNWAWIGINDTINETQFVYESDSSVIDEDMNRPWDKNQPNNDHTQNCAVMNLNTGKWSDVDCHLFNKANLICEDNENTSVTNKTGTYENTKILTCYAFCYLLKIFFIIQHRF